MVNRSNFKEGYDLIMENARVHFHSAELLAEKGHYGVANSHLILASEELIKGYIVFAQHFDHDLIVEDFNKLFSDHKHKHNKIKEMSFFISLMKQSMNIIIQPAKELYEKKGKLNKTEALNAKKIGINNFVDWLKNGPEINDNESWWNNANNYKNIGFYVNLINGEWQSPRTITKEDYEKSHSIVQEILEWLEKVPDATQEPEAMKFYNQMKDMHKEN